MSAPDQRVNPSFPGSSLQRVQGTRRGQPGSGDNARAMMFDAEGWGLRARNQSFSRHDENSSLDRLHHRDLRHTAASQAVMGGENFPLLDNLLDNLLGHRRHRTTDGYAHVADAYLVEAAGTVGTFLSRAMAIPEAAYQSENAVSPKRSSG